MMQGLPDLTGGVLLLPSQQQSSLLELSEASLNGYSTFCLRLELGLLESMI